MRSKKNGVTYIVDHFRGNWDYPNEAIGRKIKINGEPYKCSVQLDEYLELSKIDSSDET